MRDSLRYRENGADAGVDRPPVRLLLRPKTVFGGDGTGAACPVWTCVRTRPRWEKKFAAWLEVQTDLPYFLPVVTHTTVSGNKRRESEIPLFPGFVFVALRLGKGDFDRTGMVVFVLHPKSIPQEAQLHRELLGVWRGLTSGLYIEAVRTLAAGEACIITRGPMSGLPARFERTGRKGRLILQVELMGGGLAVELPESDIEAAECQTGAS